MSDQNPYSGENNTGHVWDDDLRELTNPPPRWWMIWFYISIIAVVIYGVIYPMIPFAGPSGSNQGLLGWTSIKEYQQGRAEVEALRAPFEKKLEGLEMRAILADRQLRGYSLTSAKVLFGDYCAPCHGGGGQGNPGFPVLADDDWLHGGSLEKIQETITYGRGGAMPAHKALLSEREVDTLANYVVGLSQGQQDEAGRALFTQKGCIVCHGADAKGQLAFGSANLTDAIWRFAPGGPESAKQTIRHGVNAPSDPATRQAKMPTFGSRLSETSIKKLALFVHQLGGGE